MAYDYDDNNIFARILRGEIPNDTVLETPHTLAFRDIRPLAPSHVLVIPKGRYVTFDDFAENASDDEIADFMPKGCPQARTATASVPSPMPGMTACRRCRISTFTSSAVA